MVITRINCPFIVNIKYLISHGFLVFMLVQWDLTFAASIKFANQEQRA